MSRALNARHRSVARFSCRSVACEKSIGHRTVRIAIMVHLQFPGEPAPREGTGVDHDVARTPRALSPSGALWSSQQKTARPDLAPDEPFLIGRIAPSAWPSRFPACER